LSDPNGFPIDSPEELLDSLDGLSKLLFDILQLILLVRIANSQQKTGKTGIKRKDGFI
jgi:hypothetical protein